MDSYEDDYDYDYDSSDSEELGGGAELTSKILERLKKLTKEMAKTQKQSRVSYSGRSGSKDILAVEGSCPPPMQACDPKLAARNGYACDIARNGTDPIIVDARGRYCLLPDSMRRSLGLNRKASLDDVIENISELMQKRLLKMDKSQLDAFKGTLLMGGQADKNVQIIKRF